MFNLGFTEILIVGIIALIFIGPEQLPDVARMVARFINELRRASSEFTGNMTGNITNDLQQRLQETRRDLVDQINAPIPGSNQQPEQPTNHHVDNHSDQHVLPHHGHGHASPLTHDADQPAADTEDPEKKS